MVGAVRQETEIVAQLGFHTQSTCCRPEWFSEGCRYWRTPLSSAISSKRQGKVHKMTEKNQNNIDWSRFYFSMSLRPHDYLPTGTNTHKLAPGYRPPISPIPDCSTLFSCSAQLIAIAAQDLDWLFTSCNDALPIAKKVKVCQTG